MISCRYGNGVHMMAIKGGMMGEMLAKQQKDQEKRLAEMAEKAKSLEQDKES